MKVACTNFDSGSKHSDFGMNRKANKCRLSGRLLEHVVEIVYLLLLLSKLTIHRSIFRSTRIYGSDSWVGLDILSMIMGVSRTDQY